MMMIISNLSKRKEEEEEAENEGLHDDIGYLLFHHLPPNTYTQSILPSFLLVSD